MGKLIITEPMRDGRIGVNPKHMTDPDLVIEISATNRIGEKIWWPFKYKLDRDKISEYDFHTVEGVKLTLVPLVDLIRIE
jgi:hypothetical protein